MVGPALTPPKVANASDGNPVPKPAVQQVSPPLQEMTAEAPSTNSLTSFDTFTLNSAREPTWMPPKNPQHIINLADLMKEEKTQSPETKTPDAKESVANKTARALDEPRVYSENVLNQEQFDKKFGFRRVNLSLIRIFESRFQQLRRWRKHEWRGFFKNRVPISDWLPSYDFKHDLLTDVIGGLMVSIMNVPQGLAYGFLVGLPPIYGLYSSIVGPLIYALLGTSKHVSPGAFAIIALMVGSVVEQTLDAKDQPMMGSEPESEYLCCSSVKNDSKSVDEVLPIVSCLTVAVGLIQILLGLLNAGLLAVWLSDHLVQGLTSGAAIHVLTSSMKALTVVSNLPPTSQVNGIVKFYLCFFANIETIQLAPTICSLICIVVLVFSKEVLDKAFSKWSKIKVPMELFIVVFSTLLTWSAAGTNYEFKLDVVGKVESGMKSPFLPHFNQFDKIIGSAFSVAIVGFVIHIALAKLISKKLNYSIDANQEWLALGTMNAVSACFGCFASGASLSRTMTQVRLGTKSQISTIVSATVLIIVVYGLSFCFYYLPKPVLSCIVVVALKDLICQIFHSFSLLRQSFIDFLIWLVTFLAVVLINVNIGLMVGVAFALLTVIFRSQWPESQLLGRIPGTCDFKGLNHYRSAEEVPGVFVYRFDAPLYFANAELFLNRIRDQLGLQPYLMTVELKKKQEKTNVKKELSKKLTAQNVEAQPLIPNDEKNEISLVFRGSKMKDPSSPAPKSKPEDFQSQMEPEVQFTHIIVDCSSFPYIDLMGLDALGQVHKEFASLSITVYFACCKVSVRQLFEQTDFYKRVPKKDMFVSVWDAVNQAQKDRSKMFSDKEEKTMKIELPITGDTGKEIKVQNEQTAKELEKPDDKKGKNDGNKKVEMKSADVQTAKERSENQTTDTKDATATEKQSEEKRKSDGNGKKLSEMKMKKLEPKKAEEKVKKPVENAGTKNVSNKPRNPIQNDPETVVK